MFRSIGILFALVAGLMAAHGSAYEEALKQAKDEPITKPSRDFDLD